MARKDGLLADIRSGITRGVVGHIVNWLLTLALPLLGSAAVIGVGAVQQLPWAYVIAAAAVAFGALGTGLNQIAGWNRRLREGQAVVAGPPVVSIIRTDPRHGEARAVLIHIPIANRSNVPMNYTVETHSLFMQKRDGTQRRENLAFAGQRDGTIPAFEFRTPQIPAVVVEDLLSERRFEGAFHFSILYGRNKPRHPLTVRMKIAAVCQESGEWTFDMMDA